MVTEDVDLQAFLELFLRLLDQAGLHLVHDPPLLDLTRDGILGSLQVQGHVKHFSICRGGEAKTAHVDSRVFLALITALCFVGAELDLHKAFQQVWHPSRWELEYNEGRYRLGS